MRAEHATGNGVVVPETALTWKFSRSSGPGGQHVNTSATRAELVCDPMLLEGEEEALARVQERYPGKIRVTSSTERSQLRNREAALARLLERLEEAAHTEAERKETRPSRGQNEARLREKRANKERKNARRTPERE